MHFSYLDDEFPGRWTGRRGLVELSLRSPHLWGHLKVTVYTGDEESQQDGEN